MAALSVAAVMSASQRNVCLHRLMFVEKEGFGKGVMRCGSDRQEREVVGRVKNDICGVCRCRCSLSPSVRLSAASLSSLRVSCRVSTRRSLLGRGVRSSSSSSSSGCSRGRRHATKCMYTAAALTEASVSTRPVDGGGGDGEDAGGPLPSLASKPVLTMQPPPRKSQDADIDTPPLKPAPRPVLNLRLKGSPSSSSSSSSSSVQQQHEAAATSGSANGSRNDAPGNSELKLGDNIPPPPPRAVPGKNNVAAAVANSGAIDSLGQTLEKVEKLGAGNRSEATRSSRQVGNGAERPRPQATQPGAWRAGDKLRSKAEREQALLAEERPRVSGRSDAEASTSSSAPANGAPTANRPLPLRPPPSLATQAKPILRPRAPSVEAAAAIRPKSSPAGGDEVVRKGPVLRDVGAGPRTASSARTSVNPATATAAAMAVPAKAFTKAPPPKGKEDWRKKANNPSEGVKRRVTARDKESLDVVSADLNIDIPGAPAVRRGGRKMNKASRRAMRAEAAKAAAPVRVDILEVGKEGLSCQELAQKLAINDSEIVKVLFKKGIATTVNQTLDEETVKLICQEFEVEVVEAGSLKVEDMAKKTVEFLDDEDLDHLIARPPVVTIMGHVDHGKTSLLDFIRKSKVAAGEAGGITQGIGAYRVLVQVEGQEQACVFLDTPGHEAFSAMRARGARVTDIAIIVVAADDGVRPQTLEAIAHAKAANVPIVIAINKIDKEGANPDRVMQELSTHGLMPEDWGGDVPMIQVSAVTGANVEALLETVMLVAEFQELKANPDRRAKGTVIEASLDKAKGVLATFLVQNGTIRRGDVVLCGESYGKVRALMDDTGARVDEAGPSTAVQILGLSMVPVAGDEFEVMDTMEEAKIGAAEQAEILRTSRLAAQAGEGKVTLHSFANAVASGRDTGVEQHQLNLILKVDAQGSVEAIREVLQALPQDTVALRFLLQAAGEVSASDIDLAVASNAVVVGFNVGLQPGIQTQADNAGVEIRLYKVIYDLVDDIRKAMEGLLDSVEEEVPIGEAEVRAVFGAGSGKVAGCMVTEGKLVKSCGVRVMRGTMAVHVGLIDSLRRVKEAVKEVGAGLECGVGVDGYNDWQEGDIIFAFNKVAKRRTLEDASVTVTAAVAANSNRQ